MITSPYLVSNVICSLEDGAWEADLRDMLLFHSLLCCCLRSPSHGHVVSSMPPGCSTGGERLVAGPSERGRMGSYSTYAMIVYCSSYSAKGSGRPCLSTSSSGEILMKHYA